MPINKDMLQILFKGDNKCGHWFTILTLNLKPGYVNIYDSINLEPDSQVKSNLCYLEI